MVKSKKEGKEEGGEGFCVYPLGSYGYFDTPYWVTILESMQGAVWMENYLAKAARYCM